MDENQIIQEIQLKKTEMEEKRNILLNSRGFFRTALPITSPDGLTQWTQLSSEEKDKYERAAKGTGIPGATLFFSGYRETTA
jgi:hypothetical protein